MPPEKEGVHQMPGEPSRRSREPKQGPHRRAEISEGAVLPAENGLRSSDVGMVVFCYGGVLLWCWLPSRTGSNAPVLPRPYKHEQTMLVPPYK